MKSKMRIRTALIPAKGILSALPNSTKQSFSQTQRTKLATLMLEERTWIGFSTLPANYSENRPPYIGQTFEALRMLCKGIGVDELNYLHQNLQLGVDKVLLESYGHWPEGFLEGIAPGDLNYSGPFIFDHGVSFEWFRGYLVAKWVRPTVDMQEMSVETYRDWLCEEWSHKQTTARELRDRLKFVELRYLLKENYVPPF